MLVFQSGKLLKDYTTIQIGGPAHEFIAVDSIEGMQEVLHDCFVCNRDFFILGKGSNCLFHDDGFKGLVILNKISFCSFEQEIVSVGAGYSFSYLGTQTAKKGLSGLEFASGIPGSVGGAIYMNAGASSSETADCLHEVTFVGQGGEIEILSRDQIDFSYRFSSFQNRRGAIVAASFKLTKTEDAKKKQLDLIDYRIKTQPYKDLSAGCIFRNPHKSSAGALIEKCGLKGVCVGDAEVSLIHANFIINKKEATASQVCALIRLIQQTVKKKEGVDLKMEILCIPYCLDVSC
ncbi:MAG TPA: UDP-N-acetylmuramate dehydrogenase [Candidatus Rhabdochlamydia sp.]|jgi:UDP-N-acetylmuramate dehydrogenase|nr:UDP-N-acetylmuramate dehydrogenase [Candidatus Rhabdochlamydia sp.]